ncbi:PspC domain-containing protein [Parabacteroides sp. PF5-6]|uniref:PspC domain-containing protein n=1 Tax=Parabacteroides sp. PF5-6 TaxID=1742403 RepID=UPI0024061DA0|nr:PspC domain-containing protein [Parabacteroides sp. PF5-6]MDF9831351.1 phage shock protein PspC (stress-responsive transcriptional regulator) [Parabacteroides sp. PF5-6]
MKKTLTVNLGGTVFHIDEDAYELLDKYLSNLRIHFKKEEGSDEIMNDFEIRISELLNERIRMGYEVITLEQVEDVIKRMGKPEEIFGEETFTEEAKEEYKVKIETTAKRRLFRNPDDRILGGVSGGLAAYMGWDPTAVRIAWILLTFFQITIPIYIILWLIVPLANTAAEKLQMRGESVTIENIGKTVTDGFEKVSADVNDYINSGKPRTAMQKFGDGFVSVIGFIIKVLGVLIAIALLPPVLLVLFILVVVLFAIIIGLIGGGIGLLGGGVGAAFGGIMPFMDWNTIGTYPEGALIIATIASILAIGIPLVALGYLIGVQVFKWKAMAPSAKWVLLVLWLIALALTIVLGINYGLPVIDHHGWHWNSFHPLRRISFW